MGVDGRLLDQGLGENARVWRGAHDEVYELLARGARRFVGLQPADLALRHPLLGLAGQPLQQSGVPANPNTFRLNFYLFTAFRKRNWSVEKPDVEDWGQRPQLAIF